MAITKKSAVLVFFLAQVVPPIKGVSRVRKINKTNFGMQFDTLWAICVLTLIRLGGGLCSHQRSYLSTIQK